MKNSITPRIYGFPKIHKKYYPLRPIVNTIASPSYELTKFLVHKLKPLKRRTQSFINDFSHFVENIKPTKLKENDILVSLDVVSLYTKVLVNEAIKVIRSLTDNEIINLV